METTVQNPGSFVQFCEARGLSAEDTKTVEAFTLALGAFKSHILPHQAEAISRVDDPAPHTVYGVLEQYLPRQM